MPESQPEPRRPSPVARVLLRGAIGFVVGGLLGLLFGWVVSPPTPPYIQLMVMMRGCGIGAMLGTAAAALIAGRIGQSKKD